MTYDETLKIMAVLRAAYPSYYKGMALGEADGIVKLWAQMFETDSYQEVGAAVKAYIATDASGFPPTIGRLRQELYRQKGPVSLTELEAWSMVRQAIHGASMDKSSRRRLPDGSMGKCSAEVNFEKLPPQIRRIVSSPTQLAMWERLGEQEIDTVIQSNFMRSYRARQQADRQEALLPPAIRKAVSGACKLLEDGEGEERYGD